MEKNCNLLLVTLCVYQFLRVSGTGEPVCSGGTGKRHRLSFSLNNLRNEKDEWVTKFSASQNTSVKSKNLDVDLTRSAVDCQENFFINVQGVKKDIQISAEEPRKSLFFHHNCSSNAAVSNGDRTLQKINVNHVASGLTNWPLLNDEIFTVRIDELNPGATGGIGIGVISKAPGSFDIPNHLNNIRTGKWMFYLKNIYYNYRYSETRYDLRNVKVEHRIGVMRSKSGALHLFVDGVDQGPAVSNIPERVYGGIDLYGTSKGTIVDA